MFNEQSPQNEKSPSHLFIFAQTYDQNGNLMSDLDRDVVTIQYNILNLPDNIQFKNGNQIINTYNASGHKLGTVYLI